MPDETRSEKFARILAVRLPNAIKAIELIGNLAGRDYESTKAESRALVDELYDSVDLVADLFGVESAAPAPEVEAEAERPVRKSDRDEVRWAYDALRRGDTELAVGRLKIVIEDWIRKGL